MSSRVKEREREKKKEKKEREREKEEKKNVSTQITKDKTRDIFHEEKWIVDEDGDRIERMRSAQNGKI